MNLGQTDKRYALYRVSQLNLTTEIEVFCMLFDRSLSIFSMTSLIQHIEYSHFLCKIQLDLPVVLTLLRDVVIVLLLLHLQRLAKSLSLLIFWLLYS